MVGNKSKACGGFFWPLWETQMQFYGRKQRQGMWRFFLAPVGDTVAIQLRGTEVRHMQGINANFYRNHWQLSFKGRGVNSMTQLCGVLHEYLFGMDL
jgi:hypothetical protein